MRLTAHAKINWSLAVTGKRDDGYHLLDMLMQSVELGDTVELSEAPDISFVTDGPQFVEKGAGNLVLKTALLLKEETGVSKGAKLSLHKRIPIGAGMGGGSADAAATLLGLNRLWNLKLTSKEMENFALKLGADVPFCLYGGLVRVSGIGERLTLLPSAPKIWLAVVQPCKGLSTPKVFGYYDQLERRISVPDTDGTQDALIKRDLRKLVRSMGNDLEAASVPLCPEIAVAAQTLEYCGALHAQMTGSGSAVIGVFDSKEKAASAVAYCAKIWNKSFLTCSTDRGVTLKSE